MLYQLSYLSLRPNCWGRKYHLNEIDRPLSIARGPAARRPSPFLDEPAPDPYDSIGSPQRGPVSIFFSEVESSSCLLPICSCDSWKKKTSFPQPSCRLRGATLRRRRPRPTPFASPCGLSRASILPPPRPIGCSRRQPKRRRSPRPNSRCEVPSSRSLPPGKAPPRPLPMIWTSPQSRRKRRASR